MESEPPTCFCVAFAVPRLTSRDPTLKFINLGDKRQNDEMLSTLIDAMIANPDVVTGVWLFTNQLTDTTGVKLARYLSISSTIETLSLFGNRFTGVTYSAIAEALRVNTSLKNLYLFDNSPVDRSHVEEAFIAALRFNTNRPTESDWSLFEKSVNDYSRLKEEAERL